MNKYDKFWKANELAGNLVQEINKPFDKYGTFTIESAEFSLLMSRYENIAPELFAYTWMNETTFKFYSEPNRNTPRNPEDDFSKYDVGPLQLNVGWLRKNIDVGYINIKNLDFNKIVGTKSDLFNGDPIEHSRAASIFLLRIGQAEIVAKKNNQVYTMFQKLTPELWKVLSEDAKNGRRAVAFTGPEARPHRLAGWQKFGPMFKTFFEEFQK